MVRYIPPPPSVHDDMIHSIRGWIVQSISALKGDWKSIIAERLPTAPLIVLILCVVYLYMEYRQSRPVPVNERIVMLLTVAVSAESSKPGALTWMTGFFAVLWCL